MYPTQEVTIIEVCARILDGSMEREVIVEVSSSNGNASGKCFELIHNKANWKVCSMFTVVVATVTHSFVFNSSITCSGICTDKPLYAINTHKYSSCKDYDIVCLRS